MGHDQTFANAKEHLIPNQAGVGLRIEHINEFASGQVDSPWLEIHAENYFAPGGPRINALYEVRKHYPVSVHGVGLSLGSADGLDSSHLAKLKNLVENIKPGLVSEHLSWSVSGGEYLNDLLPVPLNSESLSIFTKHIQQTQDYLGRQILIENPSVYLPLENDEIPEADFLNMLVEKTECGLLLDVNNIYVTGRNVTADFNEHVTYYLNTLNLDAVGEIHIAGHTIETFNGRDVLIDTHGDKVCQDVWDILKLTLEKSGPRPVLMEWDTSIPELSVLLEEQNKAQTLMKHVFENDYAA